MGVVGKSIFHTQVTGVCRQAALIHVSDSCPFQAHFEEDG
jgi:hypothetical protein